MGIKKTTKVASEYKNCWLVESEWMIGDADGELFEYWEFERKDESLLEAVCEAIDELANAGHDDTYQIIDDFILNNPILTKHFDCANDFMDRYNIPSDPHSDGQFHYTSPKYEVFWFNSRGDKFNTEWT